MKCLDLLHKVEGLMGISIERKADFVNLDVMIDSIITFLESIPINTEIISEIHLAVEEILVNICSYAYPLENKGNVTINCDISDDKRSVIVTFIDSGIPFDTALSTLPSLNTPICDRSIGGLGIHMVRRLMDKVYYKRESDQNILTLEKRIVN